MRSHGLEENQHLKKAQKVQKKVRKKTNRLQWHLRATKKELPEEANIAKGH